MIKLIHRKIFVTRMHQKKDEQFYNYNFLIKYSFLGIPCGFYRFNQWYRPEMEIYLGFDETTEAINKYLHTEYRLQEKRSKDKEYFF